MSYNINITFPESYESYFKVEVIKAIRGISGCSLLTAKNLSENYGKTKFVAVDTRSDQTYINEQILRLKLNGCYVSEVHGAILQKLNTLAAECKLDGRVILAEQIIELVLAEKLRGDVEVTYE